MKKAYDVFHSAFGPIYIVMDESGLKKVILLQQQWDEFMVRHGDIPIDKEMCSQAVKELEEYFSGARREFTIPLSLEGPDFSKKVWHELLKIPYGETRNYSEIARLAGSPRACRAVGQANRNNPLPIFVPCHRVIGKNGELTGYIGKYGIEMKKFLLKLELENK